MNDESWKNYKNVLHVFNDTPQSMYQYKDEISRSVLLSTLFNQLVKNYNKTELKYRIFMAYLWLQTKPEQPSLQHKHKLH